VKRLKQYEQFSEIPLLLLSVLFVVLIVTSNFHFDFVEGHKDLISALNLAIWLIFAADFIFLFFKSNDKKKYVTSHFLDLLLVILPFLRALRIVRVATLFFRKIDSLKTKFIISIPLYTFSSTLLFMVLGASAVYDAEYKVEAGNIKSPGDAIWWAVVTIFTVGYGDKFPVTSTGRWYAAGLMVCGIAVVGAVTATFASWLIGQVREVESDQEKILQKIGEIQKSLEKN
jgi:voltage-gated potassium channel